MKKILFLSVLLMGAFISRAQVSDAQRNVALQLVKGNSAAIGMSSKDINDAIVSSTYSIAGTDVTMVYLQQSYLGIPIYNQVQVLAFKNGKLVSDAGGRLASMEKLTLGQNEMPSVDAVQAVRSAFAERNIGEKELPVPISNSVDGHKFEFGRLGVASENIKAELIWMPADNGLVHLTWQVHLALRATSDFWLIRIDAKNGSFINKTNLTVTCNWDNKKHSVESHLNESHFKNDFNNLVIQRQVKDIKDWKYQPFAVTDANYTVIKYPAESPQHTGGAPSVDNKPWLRTSGNATSLGWHNDGTSVYESTKGNNVWAQEDRDNNNNTFGLSTNSTTSQPTLTFADLYNFTLEPIEATLTNQKAAITNLFYWNNLMHDISYAYGFDEVSGNFQNDNQGRGGAATDYVIADAQDAGGTNNANMSTPNDGSRPRMQMYLFTGPTPDRDGDLDNGVINHEYTHGISNRLTGGPANSSCLNNAEQGGEGWSDYFALMTTTNWATATVNDGPLARPIGTYVLAQPVTGAGIRNYPYSTNLAINPLTYSFVQSSGGEVHDIGEVWCMALWEMTWEIIKQDNAINTNLFVPGSPASMIGNSSALKLVVEGMRLQPCSPGFIDARNAILKADTIFFNKKYSCSIIKAFAKRGMGVLASQGSSNSTSDQIVDFTVDVSSVVLNTNAASVPEGQNIVYTNNVSAGNDGCGSLTNYTLTDTLPANVTYVSGGSYNPANRVVSFNPVTVAPGTTQPYSFTVSINAGTYFPPVTIIDEPVAGATIPASWTETSTTATHWTVSSAQSHSAPNSFFSADINTVSDQILATTNSFSLNATPPLLTFWHYYNSESTFDGGVVEISTDGGTNWQDIGSANFITGGYNATISPAFNSPIAGRRAFSGNSGGFIKSTVDMTPYANQANVKLRFRFGSDNSVSATGWYVDDIAMNNIPVVNMRSSLFNASNVRISKADTVTVVSAPVSVPVINAGSVTGTIVSCFGTASSSPAVQQFTVSGTTLTTDIIVNAPINFEVSTSAGSGYSSSLLLTQSGGNVPNTIIYIRSAASAPAGPISGNVILVSTGATTVNVAVSGTVNPIPSTPTITPGGPTTFCTGSSVTLTSSSATGNKWYLNGNPIGGATNQTYNATASGTYTVIVTTSGCSSSPSAGTTVTVNPIPSTPTITPGGSTTFCAGGSVTLNSSSATGNQWYKDGNSIGGATNQTYIATASGTYTVIVTSLSCSSSPSAGTVVTVNPTPSTPTITPGGPTTFCIGGSVTLTSSSATGNQWYKDGNPIGGATNQTYIATASGTYTVVVTSLSCSSSPSPVTVVTVNPIPAIPTITPGGPTTFCAGGSVTLTSSSSTGNQWYVNGNPIGGATNQTYIATASGSYTVVVTTSGCPSSPSAGTTVTANPLPLITVNAPTVTQPTCAVPTGTIVVNASGAGTLEYSIDNGVTWQLNPSFGSLNFGSYNIKVRFQGGTCSVNYTSNPIVINTPSCPGKTIPGKVEAEAFDAKLGYQYAIPTTDAGGGLQVVGISNGNWMDYNVLVTQAGIYTVNFRIATSKNNAQFQVKSGSTVLATVYIPNTGDWINWVSVPVTNVVLAAGAQTIRIQSTNDESCNFNWTDWALSGQNTVPSANAGAPQTIVSPASQVTLAGSGVANNGGFISSHTWSKLSGGAATITDASSYGTTVTGLSVGTYVFRLTVTQNDNQTATSDVTVTVNPGGNGKFIPGRIEAESFDAKQGGMFAIATTDAGGGLKVVGISNGSWMDYNVTVSQAATYTVKFRVATTQGNTQFQIKSGNTVLGTVSIPSTGGWDNWNTVTVNNILIPASGNQVIRIQSVNNDNCDFNWMEYSLPNNLPPVANAGTNQSINLPLTQATLTGSGSAGNGGTITYGWTQVGGTAATISSPNSASTTITGLTTTGTRIFRLTVTQNDNQVATSDVTVTVNPVVVSQPPTANAGLPQVIQLPTSQVSLTGSGSSNSGGGLTYGWTRVSGPNSSPNLNIVSPASASTNVTGLIQGVYVFRLTVTQSDNQTATSDVTVTVNPVVVSNGKTIPGRIEAEAWDAKSGGFYAVPTTDAGGGSKVVNITNGNTMDYNVTVLQSGNYTVGFRVATTKAFAQFQIKLGATVLATVNIPNTGGWDNWQTITVGNVALTAGNQTIRIQSTNNENCDFNWMEYSFANPLSGNGTNLLAAGKSSTATATTTVTAAKQNLVADETSKVSTAATATTGTIVELFPNPVHDQFIVKVNNDYAGDMKIQIIDQSGKVMRETGAAKNKGSNQVLLSAGGLPNGMYVIRIQTGDWSKSIKMIKL